MTDNRRFKERLYELFSQVASAMASPHRLELLDLLVQAPRTVEELARQANMSVANTSQHLQRLKHASLVTDVRQGVYIRYTLADDSVKGLWLALRGVAERQLAEVGRALNDYRDRGAEFEKIEIEDLLERMGRQEVVLVDVRPAIEYKAGHIPKAISIPLEELEQRLAELPIDKTIIAYCRGPYCAFADEALAILSERGWKVARLEEGVAEWEMDDVGAAICR
jgi:rhodanese-related sulfurtransferase